MGHPDLKNDFNIFNLYPDLVYLDAASTSLVPNTVADAVSQFLREVVVSSRRGAYSLATKGAEVVESARKLTAKFLDTPVSQISFHGTTASAVASIVFGIDWKNSGRDTIVVGASEEHDTFVPIIRAAEILGLKVRVCPVNEIGLIDIERMNELIDEQVGLVVANTNPVGVGALNPVSKISKYAHDIGALLLSDATRGIGVSDLKIQELDADVVIFSANVAFLAPPGLTIQCTCSDFSTSFQPGIVGSSAVANVSTDSYELALVPDKFESGIINVPAIAGLAAALKFLDSKGPTQLLDHLNRLAEKMWKGLSQLDNIIIYGPRTAKRTVFGFNIGLDDSLNCHDVALFLDQSNIAVRSGLLCAHPLIRSFADNGIVQASLHVYNSTDDVNRFIETLEMITQML